MSRICVAVRDLHGNEHISHREGRSLLELTNRKAFWTDREVMREFIDNVEKRDKALYVSPSEDGILVLDFLNKQVFSRQYYVIPGEAHGHSMTDTKAKNLIEIIMSGWVYQYDCFPIEEKSRYPRQMDIEEVALLYTLLGRISKGEKPDSSWLSALGLEMHFSPPGWKMDVDITPIRECWQELVAFLRNNQWRSEILSLEEASRY